VTSRTIKDILVSLQKRGTRSCSRATSSRSSAPLSAHRDPGRRRLRGFGPMTELAAGGTLENAFVELVGGRARRAVVAVGPFRAMLTAHFGASRNRVLRELGRRGAIRVLVIVLVLGGTVVVPLLFTMFGGGMWLGSLLPSPGAEGVLSAAITSMTLFGGATSGAVGGAKHSRGRATARCPCACAASSSPSSSRGSSIWCRS